MSYKITKEFSFDAAHRLVDGYVGKCSNLHGHTYRVLITVEAESLDRFGMACDFSNLSNIKDWIDALWDHSTLINSEDESLWEWLKDNGQNHYVFNSTNPTAEVMAKELFNLDTSRLGYSIKEVIIYETPKCCASYDK